MSHFRWLLWFYSSSSAFLSCKLFFSRAFDSSLDILFTYLFLSHSLFRHINITYNFHHHVCHLLMFKERKSKLFLTKVSETSNFYMIVECFPFLSFPCFHFVCVLQTQLFIFIQFARSFSAFNLFSYLFPPLVSDFTIHRTSLIHRSNWIFYQQPPTTTTEHRTKVGREKTWIFN